MVEVDKSPERTDDVEQLTADELAAIAEYLEVQRGSLKPTQVQGSKVASSAMGLGSTRFTGERGFYRHRKDGVQAQTLNGMQHSSILGVSGTDNPVHTLTIEDGKFAGIWRATIDLDTGTYTFERNGGSVVGAPEYGNDAVLDFVLTSLPYDEIDRNQIPQPLLDAFRRMDRRRQAHAEE